MKRPLFLQLAALCTLVAGARVAAAQPEPPTSPPVVVAPPPDALAPVAPTAPVATPAPASTAPAAQAAERWYDKFQAEGFVDAYAGVNFNFPASQSGANGFRAYDVSNGAALHWIGLNVSYPAAPIGGAVSLRFGPSAPLYAGSDTAINLANVKQAFASWKPGGAESKVTVDFGKFDQPFGSEVADTQFNMNYTRAMLNWYAQPFFFAGFRLDYAPVNAFGIKLFAVNGWNNTLDNNSGKSFAFQMTFKPADELIAYVGYMTGPEQADTRTVSCAPRTAFDAATGACAVSPGAAGGTTVAPVAGANKRFRHFVDVILDIFPSRDFRMLFNANYAHDDLPTGANETKGVSFYGANLGLRYAFNDTFALAGRGEVYWDSDGFTTATGKFTRVIDGTLTLAVSPSEHLQIKLDGRVDMANEAFFVKGDSDSSKTQFTTTLGVVATTGVFAPFALSR